MLRVATRSCAMTWPNETVSKMAPTPQNPPRFLPTLTEVVQPATASTLARNEGLDQAELVQRIALQVGQQLEIQLRPLVGSLVQEQTNFLMTRLQQELAPLIRQSVEQAVMSESGPVEKNE